MSFHLNLSSVLLVTIVVLFLSPTLVEIPSKTMDSSTIPTIPFSTIFSDSPSEQFIDAMCSFGFVIITEVDPEIVAHARELKKAARTFFNSPPSQKLAYNFGPYGNDRGGYTPMNVESVSGTGRDFVESYVFTDTLEFSHHESQLSASAKTYFNDMETVIKQLNRLTARGVGKEDEFFNDFFWNDVPGGNGNSLRLSFYPGKTPTSGLRYGPHTDYQTFTVLCLDQMDHQLGFGGLEVLVDDTWVPVENSPEGTSLIVNSGDLLPIWTNGLFKSVLHRVSNPTSAEGWNYDRITIPFFSGPSHTTVVKPVVQPGETTNYSPIGAENHLRMKLTLSNQ